MKSNVKWSVLSAAVLVTLSSAAAISAAQSDNGRDRYAEGVYADFASASDNAVSFDVRTEAAGAMRRLEGMSFAELTGEPTYRLGFVETRASRIQGPRFEPLPTRVDRSELDGGVEGFDVVGFPVDRGTYRILLVTATTGSESRTHRALEFCWKAQDHCVIYDPQIEFLDSVVNNYRTAKADGYGPQIQEQVALSDGISTQAVCRLASNTNIIGRSLTWSARTVTYKNIYGMTLVSKSLGGQQVGITCNSSCYPAMYGYSNASSAWGTLGYSTDCGWRHGTGTTGRKGKAVSEGKCTHVFAGTARADVTLKGTGSGIYLEWSTNGGIDGSGGALTDTCGYF
jgi:hypothetical protein